jgi:hypothetical protein
MSILNEFTKEELIYWIEHDIHYQLSPPRKSKLLFYRWQAREEALRQKREKSMEMLNAIDFKKRNEIAKQFNNETDLQKKLALSEKIVLYHKQFKAWKEFNQSIQKEEAKVKKIYQSLQDAREQEREE